MAQSFPDIGADGFQIDSEVSVQQLKLPAIARLLFHCRLVPGLVSLWRRAPGIWLLELPQTRTAGAPDDEGLYMYTWGRKDLKDVASTSLRDSLQVLALG